jgi:hypothetical protein
MECTVTWTGHAGGQSAMGFIAETGSGHILAMDGAPDPAKPEHSGRNFAPRPMEAVLAGTGGAEVKLIAMVTKDLVGKIQAGKLLGEVAAQLGGRAGGRRSRSVGRRFSRRGGGSGRGLRSGLCRSLRNGGGGFLGGRAAAGQGHGRHQCGRRERALHPVSSLKRLSLSGRTVAQACGGGKAGSCLRQGRDAAAVTR